MSILSRWSRQPMHVKLITIASVYAIIFPLLLILSNLLNWEGWSFKILSLSNALEYDPIIKSRITEPWAIITYPFVHNGIQHWAFNMLVLWSVGELFVRYHGDKPILSIFFGGSVVGALSYTLALTTLDYFSVWPTALRLVGSSAGIYALCFALGLSQPKLHIRLPLLGQVNFLIIILITYALSVLLGEHNWGGIVAHLGGALYGVVWGLVRAQGGRDYPTQWLAKLKIPKKRKEQALSISSSDKELERIITKLRHSGYKSLSEDEKIYLQKYKH